MKKETRLAYGAVYGGGGGVCDDQKGGWLNEGSSQFPLGVVVQRTFTGNECRKSSFSGTDDTKSEEEDERVCFF